ncbi:Bacterial protein of unknown function (DUF839) [Fragilaria crotonensis]|nr:Bacterial protein of unknown function (DUF839) [Fragilaria crotonensis]
MDPETTTTSQIPRTTSPAGLIDRVQSKGDVLGYRRVLSGTQRNCGGGRSPYNTWLSCEENGKNGFVWEVSPGGKFVGRKTNLVPEGGNYESVAYEFDLAQGRNVYYITEDSPTGALVQFVPSANLGTRARCTRKAHRYLRVDSGNFGTFSWVAKKSNATPQLYPNVEGIDAKDGFLYFVSKVDKTLFILNLAAGIFTKESTNQDELTTFANRTGSYCGIHGRTSAGKYVTIIDNDPNSGLLTGETTGLAFSPDGRRMYVSFQKPGVIFEISRTDGYSFGGDFIDVKYHAI